MNVHNDYAGLSMVWQRLEEIYGSPEVIENALLKKVEDFPKITNRENHRLRELGDILMELDAARIDGYLPGLSYLNTSRGVTPIVQKLPYGLQEKWISLGSRYKAENRVPYPPFSIFVKFVCDKARERNDPSFASIMTGTPPAAKMEKSLSLNPHTKPTVAVRKMGVAADGNSSSNGKMENDTDKQCPLHNKPHPLRKCRGFRSKTLDERKSYLKENNICFKCCASSTHVAKDCDKLVQCTECNSNRHLSALHPGPAPWKAHSKTSPAVQGGEQHAESVPQVTSNCTEVCGNVNSSRSCSKISLVKVFPAGQRDRAVNMYIVLDEQSNRSLARTEFF